MELYNLRVNRTVAGKKFPFDRIYLVNKDDAQVLDELFRFALVLPVTGHLLKMLKDVKIDDYVNRTFHRDDAEQAAAKLRTDEWKTLLEKHDWTMGVPILPKWIKSNVPRYLTAEHWHATRMTGRKNNKTALPPHPSPFTTRSYLHTPHRNIRPICVMCPNYIAHQNGDCELGQPICFEQLTIGNIDHFEETLALPDATQNVKEPEEYDVTAGEDDVGQAITNASGKDLLRIIHE